MPSYYSYLKGIRVVSAGFAVLFLLSCNPSNPVETRPPGPAPSTDTLYVIDTQADGLIKGNEARDRLQPYLAGSQTARRNNLTIDYPLSQSLFPPGMTAPTVVFHDGEKAERWFVDVSFADSPNHIYVLTDGRKNPKVIDSRCQKDYNIYEETPYQKEARNWLLKEDIWKDICRHVEKDISLSIFGISTDGGNIVSDGRVNFRISKDPVDGLIFYRDVPLMPSKSNEGVIQPLSTEGLPLIEWRLRDISEPEGKVVMKGLPTCGNCHSFSADGSLLGMDMDGPSGDKGAYTVVPIRKRMSIESEDVFTWNSFRKDQDSFGLLSRVSPDGDYVVSSVDESVFVVNYADYKFLQTFYPTRAKLGIYNRKTREIKLLPGADDPDYVNSNAVWSPDGKTITFIRAGAMEAFPPGVPIAKYANDPNERQIQYDLWRIPFNDGKGGTPEPITGASNNGKSNSFPKYSPDGKWIVYVQAQNGFLMRPDSELYIIPAEGGTARRMNCNTKLMNSWHSWSPNSRWLVFSSKKESPYTQLYLTHIDENGNDSPPVLIPNSTADNRAANLPEFLNRKEKIEDIQVPAVDYRRHLDLGEELIRKKDFNEAQEELRKSLELRGDYSKTYHALGYALSERGEVKEAIEFFKKALEMDPRDINAHCYLGLALIRNGRPREAREHFFKALEVNPMNSQVHFNLGSIEAMEGNLTEAVGYFRKAIELYPEYPDAHYNLGLAYSRQGDFFGSLEHFEVYLKSYPDDPVALGAAAFALNRTGDTQKAVQYYEKALLKNPREPGLLNNLAWILAAAPDAGARDGKRALELAQRLNEITQSKVPAALDTLAAAYAETGLFDKALETITRSLDLTDPSDPRRDFRLQMLDLFKNRKKIPIRRIE